MAKYRHIIFEMYDFRDEAARALTPNTPPSVTDDTIPESWDFRHLTVSREASVMHVAFKGEQSFGEETVGDLRQDFGQLADKLGINSKVLLDFAGVKSFCAASVEILVRFNQILRHKGSRIVLCCLHSETRTSFFPARSP